MFVEQTLVNTRDGFKELSELTTEDYVLTSQQTYEKIGEIKTHNSNGVYRIQTQGNPELYADGETLLRVRTRLKAGKDGREFSNEKWVKVKNLKAGDFVLMSKNRKVSTGYTKQLAWLYAKYFLNGKLTKNDTVIIYIEKTQISTLKKMSKNISYAMKELKNSYRVEIYDNTFVALCKSGGELIDMLFMQSADSILMVFLMSMVEDTEKNDNNYYVIKSKNRKFIYQIGQIISNINSLGGYSLFLSGEEKVSYRLLFNDEIPKQAHFTCIGNKLYQPVRSVTEISAHRGMLIDIVGLSFAANNIVTKGV